MKMPPPVDDGALARSPQTSDKRRLHELGYAQELLRSMGGFSNLAVSFTIISILSGCRARSARRDRGGVPRLR
jgi:hypothetical protein